MFRILPGIHSLEQRLEHLQSEPEAYRPECCPPSAKPGCGDLATMRVRPRRANARPIRWASCTLRVFFVRIVNVPARDCPSAWHP